jgi:hypothetical protein
MNRFITSQPVPGSHTYRGASPPNSAYTLGCLRSTATISATQGQPAWHAISTRPGKSQAT